MSGHFCSSLIPPSILVGRLTRVSNPGSFRWAHPAAPRRTEVMARYLQSYGRPATGSGGTRSPVDSRRGGIAMSDRMDELKGNLKEGAGKLTGNERMEAEGDTQADTAKAKREAKGAAREAGGSLKEAAGKLVGSERTEAEGKADKLRGKSERAG